MKNSLIITFILFVFFSCKKDDHITTSNLKISKGIFGLRDSSKLSELDAEYTRILVWDTDLKTIYNDIDNGILLENNLYYNQIKSIYDDGIKIILTLRWPDQNSSDPALYDRVPLSQDKVDSLNLLSRFLTDFGPLIEIYSIQNEVGGLGPGTYSQNDMINNNNGSPAVLWWRDIVTRLSIEKENNPKLAHLKISSPVPVLLKKIVFDSDELPETIIDFFYETIKFGNEYCDYVDLHLNTFTLEEHKPTLDFLNSIINKPMIASEWSEVNSANNYINKTISNNLLSFANNINYTIPDNITTNNELIEYLYNNPSTIDFWELIIHESNYEENFMEQSSQLLSEAGFEIICWNSGWQEGLTAYDLRSFYATKTVGFTNNELTDFTIEFKKL